MSNNFLRYINEAGYQSSTERLELYVAQKKGYIRYSFIHCVSEAVVADNWRICEAVYVDDTLSGIKPLTVWGEWEEAIRLKGRDDFAGGIVHGDELADSIAFFVDGRVTDLSSLCGDVEFDKLTVVQRSRLLDPADHKTVIADHGKEYTFTGERLVIDQFVDWKVSEHIDVAYLAMFPVSKEFTESYYTNRDMLPSPIKYGSYRGVTSAASYNGSFTGRFFVSKYPKKPEECIYLITDNGGGGYNKQYYVAAADEDVYPGLRWESTTGYELSYSLD